METKTGLFTDIMPSGAGFVTFADGRQAFVLPSLIRTMSLRIGDEVECELISNFADRATARVPWRVLRVTIQRRADPVFALDSGMEDLLSRCFGFLEQRGGSWTSEELAEEFGAVESRFVSRALELLFERGRVHRAEVFISTCPSNPEVFYALDVNSLIPVGALEDEDEEETD